MNPEHLCAKTDCGKPALGDQPRLCTQHTLEFFAILGGVTQARWERERAGDERTNDT